MRTQRNTVYVTIVIMIISVYLITQFKEGTVYLNILIGFFSSSLLLLTSSIVSYIVEKEKGIKKIVEDLNNLQEELNTLYIGKDKLGISNNLKILDKCSFKLFGSLWEDYNDMVFIKGIGIKRYIKKDILEPLEILFRGITSHYGMLRCILLYECNELDINTHYIKCVKLSGGVDMSEKLRTYISFDDYKKLTIEDKLIYHNNQIISALIAPQDINEKASSYSVHTLSFLNCELGILSSLKRKVFISSKYIKKSRKRSIGIANKWDNISNDMDKKIKEDFLSKENGK